MPSCGLYFKPYCRFVWMSQLRPIFDGKSSKIKNRRKSQCESLPLPWVVFQMIKPTQEELLLLAVCLYCNSKQKKEKKKKLLTATCAVGVTIKLVSYLQCFQVGCSADDLFRHYTTLNTHSEWFRWFWVVLKIQMQVRSGYITLIGNTLLNCFSYPERKSSQTLEFVSFSLPQVQQIIKRN